MYEHGMARVVILLHGVCTKVAGLGPAGQTTPDVTSQEYQSLAQHEHGNPDTQYCFVNVGLRTGTPRRQQRDETCWKASLSLSLK